MKYFSRLLLLSIFSYEGNQHLVWLFQLPFKRFLASAEKLGKFEDDELFQFCILPGQLLS